MAATYQNTHGGDRPIVILSPRKRAHLVAKQGTITANYPQAIRFAYTGPPLKQHIQQCNKWSDATMASINWTSHGQALRNHFPLRLHFSKLVHDILPTAAQQNKMDKGKRTCPMCLHTLENRDHIIKCPHFTRNKWRHALLTTALHASCITQFTYAPIRELLVDIIREWMYADTQGQDFIVNDSRYSLELRLLIRQQNNIGWRQLFHGRFSVECRRLQGDFDYRTRAERPGQHHKFTGDGWQVSIITLLWKHWRELWKQRNQDVHGRDAASITTPTKRKSNGDWNRFTISKATWNPAPNLFYAKTSINIFNNQRG
jgi:hypothetical protein